MEKTLFYRLYKLVLLLLVGFYSVLATALVKQSDRQVDINGFGTVGITSTDSKEAPPDSLSNSQVNWGEFTRLGINFSKRLDSEFMGVFQLIGNGNKDNFNVEVDLVHLIYRPFENLSFVFGKQKLPSFIVSKYRETGFLTDWVREPWLLYLRNPLNNFIGGSMEYRHDIGSRSYLSLEIYGGISNVNQTIGNLLFDGESRDLIGARLEFNSKNFMAYVNYFQTQVDLNGHVVTDVPSSTLLGPNPQLPDNLRLNLFYNFDYYVRIYTGGFQLKLNKFSVYGEGYGSDTPDSSVSDDLDKYLAGYLALKYAWTPKWSVILTYMDAKSFGNNFRLPSQTDTEQYSLGANYMFSEKVMAKIAIESQKYFAATATNDSYTRYLTSLDFLF